MKKERLLYCTDREKLVNFNSDCINCKKWDNCVDREQISSKGLVYIIAFLFLLILAAMFLQQL